MSPRLRLAVAALLCLAAVGGCRRAPTQTFAYTNRLAAEKSPYLQQHAHNPVDWYPWGQEAFDKARRENKPIFLSVGYSTCHWCHVMEQESFSNPAMAEYMNAHFVSIKVDREERPDIDRLYQNYVIGVSEGGWPMTLFLTPELKPFFGANYLPPDDRDNQPGLRTTLERVATLWETRRDEALRAAATGTQAMEERSKATTGAPTLDAAQVFDDSFKGFAASFDAAAGGFGGAPKFPRPVALTFLMHYYARTGARPALDMTTQTLRAMATGGLRDHLGGGFHRYTVDRDWRVPHFEKMLYDQAQLTVAYIDAYQATHDAFFRDIARETLEYVLRDMRDGAGGFYSAEDADSPDPATGAPGEGVYYLWSLADVRTAAGPDAETFAYHYGLPPTGTAALNERHTVAETAAHVARSEDDVRRSLENARRALLQARAKRPRPPRDEKVLVSWNGLMVSALARGAQVLGDQRYLNAADTAARFIWSRMYDRNSGTLKRRSAGGVVDIDALLEDYAFLIQGALDLYEASFDPQWLTWAAQLQSEQDRLFWDAEGGGYFSTRADAAHLLARAKEEYDSAEPAANSVSAMNLLRLWKMTANNGWRDRADATFRALAPRLARSGGAMPAMLAALDFVRSRGREIVIAGDPSAADTRALLRVVRDRYIPNKVVLVADGGARQAKLQPLVPFLEGMTTRDGRATIYVCENYACRLPTTDPQVAARLLAQ